MPAVEGDPGVTPPHGNNSNVIGEDDYPMWSLFFGQQGTTILRVLVREDGTIGGAEIDQSSGYLALDAAALDIVKRRFRYSPATRDGKPVAFVGQTAVKWLLYEAENRLDLFAGDYFYTPPDPLPQGAWHPDPTNRISAVDWRPGTHLPAHLRLRVHVRSDGSVAEVQLIGSSGAPRLDRAASRMVVRRFRYPAGAEGWREETIDYVRGEQPYPLPLPPVCRDAPHAGAPGIPGLSRPDLVQEFLINEDGSVGASLSWDGNIWSGSTLAGDINRENRFFPPLHDGTPAKCWFDLVLPPSR
jgi:TonB family protein